MPTMQMGRLLVAALLPFAGAIAAPAYATVYVVQISGKVTSVYDPVSTIGDVTVGDAVDYTFRFDDAAPGADIYPTGIFSVAGYPTPFSGVLTINGVAYDNPANDFGYYSTYLGNASSIIQNTMGTGTIDDFSFDTNNKFPLPSDDFRQTGSWYVGPHNVGEFERQTPPGSVNAGPDYTVANVDFGFHFLTVYKEGDPIPPLPPGAVPEPATWAMMLCGIGAVGGIMRRRQQTNAITSLV